MSILFATPMYGGSCHHAYFRSALQLHGYLVQQGTPHDFYTLYNESAVHRARNQCVKAFLQTDYTHLMFIDADIEFTVDDVGMLHNLDADVAVGCYRMKRDDAPYAAWNKGKLLRLDDLPKEPFPVDYAGTGFMLIKREVLETLSTKDNLYEGKDGQMHQIFDFPLRDGIELSEDYAFCEDARNKGFTVMMDPSVKLKHWGIKSY